MTRRCLALAVLALVSCGEKKEPGGEKPVMEKALDSYGALIEKAKQTEAVLQKKADSILQKQDSLEFPR